METPRKVRDPAATAAQPQAWLFGGADDGEFALLELPVHARPLPPSLTTAEREVATLAATGLAAAEIARRRRRATRTVANQLQSVYRKLGIASRRELQAWLEAPAP